MSAMNTWQGPPFVASFNAGAMLRVPSQVTRSVTWRSPEGRLCGPKREEKSSDKKHLTQSRQGSQAHKNGTDLTQSRQGGQERKEVRNPARSHSIHSGSRLTTRLTPSLNRATPKL